MATGAFKNLVTTTTSIGAGEVDLNKGRFGKSRTGDWERSRETEGGKRRQGNSRERKMMRICADFSRRQKLFSPSFRLSSFAVSFRSYFRPEINIFVRAGKSRDK